MTDSSGANTGAVIPTIGPIEIVIARRAPSGQSGIDSPATNLRINCPHSSNSCFAVECNVSSGISRSLVTS